LQQFLAVGFVANKFTGGALQDVFTSLASGLIKGILGINAGVVHINAGAVRGGGVPVGGGGGGLTVANIAKGLAGLGIGFVGSNVLSGGVQQGGTYGAAQGALGGAAMIGGGALAFGPIGAILGSILAVGQTQVQVSEQSTAIARGNSATLSQWLTQSPKREDLVSGLAAVDQGIAEITANPLNVLVAGDALAELQAQRAALQAAIAADAQHTAMLAGQAVRNKDDTVAAQNRTAMVLADKSDANRSATLSTSLSQVAATARAEAASRAAGQVAAAAIRDKDLSVSLTTYNSTNVSIRDTVVKTASASKIGRIAS
jgi:hypothetical protein